MGGLHGMDEHVPSHEQGIAQGGVADVA
jgi:hypothetical protein